MTLAPVEIVVIGFPENRFTGAILPELATLVNSGTISIIDGLFVSVDREGVPTYVELDELAPDSEVGALISILDRVDGLLSDDDVTSLVDALDPNSSAAVLVFEHSWVKPLRDAVVDSGGMLVDTIRIPGSVVSEVKAALEQLVEEK